MANKKTVGIINYGTGNIASLDQAFSEIEANTCVINNHKDFEGIDALVLPGVGHFGHAQESLKASGLREKIVITIKSGLPVLGICLGFQMLTTGSEESADHNGLGLLPLKTERLNPIDSSRHKVPHLGWNLLHEDVSGSPKLLTGIDPNDRLFYFANSFGVQPINTYDFSFANYQHEQSWLGLLEFNNICGVQFHPEKSRSQGLRILQNFLQMQ